MTRTNSFRTVAGRVYRELIGRSSVRPPVRRRIGPYGPFRLDPYFAFMDLRGWGSGHNSAFESCIEACRGAGQVADVGAHVGFVTLPMSSVVAPGGVVHAFEPATTNLDLLKRHLRVNRVTNVEVDDRVVADEDGVEVDFFELPDPSGMNSLVVKRASLPYARTTRKTVTLDSVFSATELDVLKIDVEGAELAVLQGARNLLHLHHPLLCLSVHPQELALLGASVTELELLLRDAGYSFFEAPGTKIEQLGKGEYLLRVAGHG